MRSSSIMRISIVMLFFVLTPEHSRCQMSTGDSSQSQVVLGRLPQGIASFGAAELNGFAYVYSGHTGRTHAYSRDWMMVSFLRIDLRRGGAWEVLPMERPAQGVSLISDGTRLYRIGGLHAVNEPGDPAELYSIGDFAAFDPSEHRWQALPELPEPRSSHRSAVLHGQVYVFGGWTLHGEDEGLWLDHGLVFDLHHPIEHWKKIAQPVPLRGAEVVAYLDRIWLLGGLTPDGSVSSGVYVYDPVTAEWTCGPDLPLPRSNGNGLAATVLLENPSGSRHHESLLVSCVDGALYRLNVGLNVWESIASISPPRIHHRLVTADEQLYVIGGAARQGHLSTIDRVRLDAVSE